MYAKPIQHFKVLQFLVVPYDMGFLSLFYRRCQNSSGLFSLLYQFLEAEMTKSPPIIVREFMFQTQNLCFASR